MHCNGFLYLIYVMQFLIDEIFKNVANKTHLLHVQPSYTTPVPRGKAYFVDTFDDSLIGQK